MRRGALVALLALGVLAAPAQANTKWLCKPGAANDVCNMGLESTRFAPDGTQLDAFTPHASPIRKQIDCFYVYPTVSDQKSINATKAIDPEIRSIARYQAARYEQDCRVYAPVYRQLTLQAINSPDSGDAAKAAQLAYGDVRAAWLDYLKHDNHGRGVVLIGHSQGSAMLIQLVRKEIDNKPAVRRKLVSAILLGGNVAVPKGKDVGGSFKHVPACRAANQFGCVIAFSTFGDTPPEDSLFGRTGGRIIFGLPGGKNLEIMCTNPAAMVGNGKLTPVSPAEPFAPGTTIALATQAVGYPPAIAADATTPFFESPHAFSAKCSHAGGANVLRVTPRAGAPTPKPVPNAQWGLHLLDANIALGNLAKIVRSQSAAYAMHR